MEARNGDSVLNQALPRSSYGKGYDENYDRIFRKEVAEDSFCARCGGLLPIFSINERETFEGKVCRCDLEVADE